MIDEHRPFWYEPVGDVATSDEPPRPIYDLRNMTPLEHKHVALTRINGKTGDARDIAIEALQTRNNVAVFVSTVFLSVDYNHSMQGPPVLWESLPMHNGEYLDNLMQRYTSRRQAIAGHIALVRFLSDCVKRGEPITKETEFDWEEDTIG